MIDEKRARNFIEKFGELHSKEFFKHMDDNSKGLHAIMHMLSVSGGTVLAGDIANELRMSTPRVAAALKTLEAKGHIARTAAESDARRTVVRLTDSGTAEVERCERGLAEFVDYLMESVGERDMNELLRISQAIASALDKKFGESGGTRRFDV